MSQILQDSLIAECNRYVFDLAPCRTTNKETLLFFILLNMALLLVKRAGHCKCRYSRGNNERILMLNNVHPEMKEA